MKNPAFRPIHKLKQPTTNAAPGTHKEFCNRCFARNSFDCCPRTKSGRVDIKACTL